MKILKGLLYAALGLGALFLFGRFFLSALKSGDSGRGEQLAGVLLSPPPGYAVAELGETTPEAAAAELEASTLRSGAAKAAVHFRHQGAETYWLADSTADLLEERSAGASGTRLQTIWQGGLRERLAWAKTHGTFETPGLAPGKRANLYH